MPEKGKEITVSDSDEKDWKALYEEQLKETEKWKAFSRKHEDRVKELAEKARKFDESQEANKTDLEKAVSRAESAEKNLSDLEQKVAGLEAANLRAQVANEKRVPADLLTGSTKEELEAAADRLIEFRGELPKAPPADGVGDQGEEIREKELSADEIAARI